MERRSKHGEFRKEQLRQSITNKQLEAITMTAAAKLKKEGKAEGKAVGALIGKIQLLESFLGRPATSMQALDALDLNGLEQSSLSFRPRTMSGSKIFATNYSARCVPAKLPDPKNVHRIRNPEFGGASLSRY
jgi:hypothetical protein